MSGESVNDAIRWNLEPSYLVFRASTWTFAGNHHGVLMEIDGEYRHGSAGADDAKVMHLRITEACELARAAALVVDLRKLDYEWGDDITISPRGTRIPELAVIRDEQRKAFAPMLGSHVLRTDLDAALDEIERLATPEPSRKGYVWTEVWRGDDIVSVLRGATDGSVDRFSAAGMAIPVPRQSYTSEAEAHADLEKVGYRRVQGRS